MARRVVHVDSARGPVSDKCKLWKGEIDSEELKVGRDEMKVDRTGWKGVMEA